MNEAGELLHRSYTMDNGTIVNVTFVDGEKSVVEKIDASDHFDWSEKTSFYGVEAQPGYDRSDEVSYDNGIFRTRDHVNGTSGDVGLMVDVEDAVGWSHMTYTHGDDGLYNIWRFFDNGKFVYGVTDIF